MQCAICNVRNAIGNTNMQHTVRSARYAVRNNAVCDARYAIRCMQYATYDTQYAMHSTQYAIRDMQYAICNMQYTVRNKQSALRITQYTSPLRKVVYAMLQAVTIANGLAETVCMLRIYFSRASMPCNSFEFSYAAVWLSGGWQVAWLC